jgi:hypothetical protein
MLLVHPSDQTTIETGKPLLLDFHTEPSLDFVFAPGAEFKRNDLGSSLPKSVGDIFPGNHEIAGPVVNAAQHDMGVGMAGIEVIDGNPVQLRTEVIADLLHQPPNDRLEVLEPIAVFCRDDEAELMPISIAALEKILPVNAVIRGTIKLSGLAFPGNSISLYVMEVSPGCS